ncbi:metal ABC transporter substrate-binding protein [Thioalkalivibrio nitratireducens]|nr:metal ABC transporter substrate-binding protein [Thioalkalivibrio nitratireducens]
MSLPMAIGGRLVPAVLTALLLFALSAASVQAGALNVVTTTSTMGMLAREIGAERVEVRVLAAPDRDPHYLDARPAFMAALRRADLLVEKGGDLEEGWLPAALTGAANPRLNSGRPGHFRASDFLHLRRSITMDGPNLGHVHGEGNPHFQLDPQRVAAVAAPLAARLGELLPADREAFEDRARMVSARILEHAETVATRLDPGQRFVAYHEDIDYLEEWLPVEIAGYLEPLPGIPPTARHLRSLADSLRDGPEGVVLHAVYQPARGAEFLAAEIGWSRQALPMEPPANGGLEDYLELMQVWAAAFQAGE